MTHFRPVTTKDVQRDIIVLAIFIFLAAALLVATVMFKSIWLALLLIAFCLMSTLALAKRHNDTYGYECPFCKCRFEISLGTALSTPHIWNKKLLRCPSCGKRGWTQEVVKVK